MRWRGNRAGLVVTWASYAGMISMSYMPGNRSVMKRPSSVVFVSTSSEPMPLSSVTDVNRTRASGTRRPSASTTLPSTEAAITFPSTRGSSMPSGASTSTGTESAGAICSLALGAPPSTSIV